MCLRSQLYNMPPAILIIMYKQIMCVCNEVNRVNRWGGGGETMLKVCLGHRQPGMPNTLAPALYIHIGYVLWKQGCHAQMHTQTHSHIS